MHLELTHLGYAPRTYTAQKTSLFGKISCSFMWLKTTFHIDLVNVGL